MQVEIQLVDNLKSIGTFELPARPIKGDRIVLTEGSYIVRRIYMSKGGILAAVVKFNVWNMLLY